MLLCMNVAMYECCYERVLKRSKMMELIGACEMWSDTVLGVKQVCVCMCMCVCLCVYLFVCVFMVGAVGGVE
jgi:hypothetical protein